MIELLVVISILGILAAIGAPALSNMMKSTRLSSTASALQVSLSLARSEAVKRGSNGRVTVAANTTAGVWSNGWTVFVDGTSTANNGVAPTADSSSVTRLEVVAAPSGGVSYGSTRSDLSYFTYDGRGRLVDKDDGLAYRSFWFFTGDSDKYCIVISSSGRARAERVATGSDCSTG
jgi:type IV fimbrial biogenesis protein FimT